MIFDLTGLFERASPLRFLQRHPSVRQALAWSIPALLLGGALRMLFLHYSPYAYWGSDSRSYYDFTYKLFASGDLSLTEKRRVLYPIFMALLTLLPGAPLQWVAWVQHAFGLISLIPLAYLVRKSLTFWRWWIVPITAFYSALPLMIWYEHELLGETIFFNFLLWAIAGWAAWHSEARMERAARLWWCFFVPFALFILTKPSARFYWPGLLIPLVVIAFRQRRLLRSHILALGALILVTLSLGSKIQGAWLFYVSVFPLTQLETKLHADYKAEIRELVEAARSDIHLYYERDDDAFQFTRNPSIHPDRKLWVALDKDLSKRARIHMDLALEAVRAEPLTFLYFGLQRLVASANLSEFNTIRFRPDHIPRRFRVHYDDALERIEEQRPTPIPLVLGYPVRGPIPPYEEVQSRLSPAPASMAAAIVRLWVDEFRWLADVVVMPPSATLAKTRPTLLGLWLLAGIALSFFRPYRGILGVWAFAALGYLAGIFLISQVNARYFAAAWPVLVPLLAVPADAFLRTVAALASRKRA